MGGRTGWKNWINAGARLVLLAAGVYGCLLLLRSSDGIACSPWAVYGGGRAYCVCSCGFPPAGEKAVCWLCRHCSFWDPGRHCFFSWPAPCWLQSSPCWNLSWATTGSSIS